MARITLLKPPVINDPLEGVTRKRATGSIPGSGLLSSITEPFRNPSKIDTSGIPSSPFPGLGTQNSFSFGNQNFNTLPSFQGTQQNRADILRQGLAQVPQGQFTPAPQAQTTTPQRPLAESVISETPITSGVQRDVLPQAEESSLAIRTLTLPSGQEVQVNANGEIVAGLPSGGQANVSQDGSIVADRGDFKVETPSGNISADTIAAATDAPTETDILSPVIAQQEFLQDLQQQILNLAQPTELEQETAQQIRDLNLQEQQAQAISEARQAPTFAIRGEQAEIARMGAIQRQSLTNQLNALSDARTGRLQALTTQAGFTNQNIQNLFSIGEALQSRLATEPQNFEATRQAAIVNLVSQGITDPTQIFNAINFDEQGNQVGDVTVSEIQGVLEFVNTGQLSPKEQRELTKAEEVAENARVRSVNQADVALTNIGGILDKLDGFLGGNAITRIAASKIPGTEARDMARQLDTVKALIGFDALEEMRNASPTGGALGQVSEREIDFLQSVRGSLDIGQSTDQLRSTLQGIQESFRTLKMVNGTPEEQLQVIIDTTIEAFPDATDEEISDIVQEVMEEQGAFNPVGGDTQSSLNRPQRNNNPLNIKASEFTKSFPGVAGVEDKPAQDGGNFLRFESPTAGFNAAKRLIQSDIYSNLNLEQALRKWSGGGYGAEILPEFKNKRIKDLTQAELNRLVRRMAESEGFFA